ncbi:MAG: restriction endonuclease subunit S [Lepagella sp.]
MKEPKIRFKRFKGEWEETSLGKLSTNYKYGINAAAIPYDGTNKYLRITDIDENTRMFSQEDLTSPGTDLSCCNEYLLEEGDITIARTGASVGKSYIYHLSDGKVYFAGFLIRTRLNENVDKDYVFYSTLTDKYAKYIRLVSQRSGQPGVNVEELKGYTFNLPCDKAEQQKIASYFQHLDTLIQSTTKKIESLKQVKAASLQSMFPQEGETTPRVRFKGFEGDWEKVSFGQFGSVAMCKRIFKDQTMDKGEVPFYKIGTFAMEPDAYISKELFIEYKSKFSFPQKGDILISAAGTIGRTIQYNGEDAYFQDSNIVWLKHGNEIDNTFLMYIYSLVKWNGLEGATIKRLYNNIILETEFLLPPVEEQRAIASFFTNLDRQITLQTQRLEKLKQIKAACLDNMFV